MQCRKEQRREVSANCRIHSRFGLPQRATIRDLSPDGCAIVSPRLTVRRADRVIVEIGFEKQIEAEVRWTRPGDGVGLRFRRPLSDGAVNEVVVKARNDSIYGVAPRRMVSLENTKLRPAC